MLKVTILCENTALGPSILGEHGLAYWIDTQDHHLLFDTGQGLGLLPNARSLGIPLDRVEAVALSHGHYDHTGGLPALLPLLLQPTLFLHPAAMAPKYSRQKDGAFRAIGMPATEAELKARGAVLVYSTFPTEIFPGMRLTGEIPRETDFEDTGGPFFLDPEGREPDPLRDDQALILEVREGVVVLLGCGHSGVINTLRHVRSLTAGKPVVAVMGGMHLGAASETRLEKTKTSLQDMQVRRVMPGHCTGPSATACLMQGLGPACQPIMAGATYTFD